MVKLANQREPIPIETPFIKTPAATARQVQHQLELGYRTAPWFLPMEEATELVRVRARELLALGMPESVVRPPHQRKRYLKAILVGESPVFV